MKRMDLFCSSPASTAVSYSMYHRSSSNLRKTSKSYDKEQLLPHVPCSSQLLPINPKSYLEKHRKSSAEKERRKSSVHVNDLYTGSGSSESYLLDDAPFIDLISPPQHDDKDKSMVMKTKESRALIRSSSSANSNDQVVVLRVSLHCRACEGKLRKHILKMEGVRSFNIEMEKKKVTIIGDVTPLGVLANVSKVKNAQLW